uniref:ADM2 n=1 Tax=Varanus komodoensis TaxID=61221 RepID=A0A8D2LV45_VARKO
MLLLFCGSRRPPARSHEAAWTMALRRKRHAAARLHHAQLMRVGCALGTCQVQNLSHRLWQLKGQSGRRPEERGGGRVLETEAPSGREDPGPGATHTVLARRFLQ